MPETRSRITVVIVNWNGSTYLPRCLSALAYSGALAEVILIDNASTDTSIAYVKASHQDVEIHALSENVGYAGGANAGIRAAKTEFIVIMNPDVVLTPDHVDVMLSRFNADPKLGAAQGRLHQVTPEDYVAGHFHDGAPLDSAGHVAARTRMVYDRGQGELANGRFTEEEPVFSACGAALFLRRSMLEDIAIDGEFFDESFFAYKEDIDLCWRARLLGWEVRYVPEAVGWHVRGWASAKAPSPAKLPYQARFHSFKNHYLLLLKNETASNLIRDLPWVVGWEILRQGHALLRDRCMYRVYPELLRMLPAILRKRREVMRRSRVTSSQMRQWFG